MEEKRKQIIREQLPRLIQWIQEKMKESGGTKAIIGISGGKDSSVVAALCVKALGKENVVGVLMPDGEQHDIQYSYDLCKALDISHGVFDIHSITSAALDVLDDHEGSLYEILSQDSRINLPSRVRMAILYAISQSVPGGRVINTSNLSEDWVGYATIYGDTAGAFSPLATFITDEVIELGRQLGLEEKFIMKPPEDGLTGKTDEEKLGFTYAVLNRYIRTGEIEDMETKATIDRLHRISRFKFQTIPMYPSGLPIVPEDVAKVYGK